ncbi:DNA-3-methyladenine glycosylase [Tomitella biformata]|uniref:DNA-3-methyladenine glycosylase n=1 Tax=Tomitella biformata TaxID=630403 RepID=UPI00046347FA|nr:DNA-3-methyladenine glycosylase [Tomitella biformata]
MPGPRARLAVEPLIAARRLLGARLRSNGVTVRIVEVEAYHGSEDSASHAFRGITERNKVMFGPAGHLYVYRSYGIHTCLNVSAGPDGIGWAVLLRAGEVLDGAEVAVSRRPKAAPDNLARGPGNLGAALGITLGDGGADLLDPHSAIRLMLPAAESPFRAGPRVGVSTNAEVPWRLWVPDSRAVSAYRRSPRAADPSDAGPFAADPARLDAAHGDAGRSES